MMLSPVKIAEIKCGKIGRKMPWKFFHILFRHLKLIPIFTSSINPKKGQPILVHDKIWRIKLNVS